MGGYSRFKFENSLVSSIYPTSPLDYESNHVPETDDQARKEMLRAVSERGKYFYTYAEYTFARLYRVFCCCCVERSPWFNRRVKKLERHEEAVDRLNREVDVCKLVQVQRITQFMAKM